MKTLNAPKIPQRERKHQAIIDAAIKVFLQNGFEASSMDEVAREAGVSKRTVYDHFGNKEKLFQTILVEHWNFVFEINEPLFDTSKSITESLSDFAKKFMTFLYQPKTINLFRLLIGESGRLSHLLDALLVNEKAPFTKELITYLDSQQKNGKFKIKDAELAASFFMGMLKEPHFWPMMLGFTTLKQVKHQNQFIKEAVEIFIKTYAKI